MEPDPSDDPSERDSPWSSGRVSGRCGCIAALLFAFPVGCGVLLGFTLGDCGSGVPCHQHDTRNLTIAFAAVLALAALFGFAVRTLVRWWRLRGTAASPGLWPLLWAVPIAILFGFVAVWSELAVLGIL